MRRIRFIVPAVGPLADITIPAIYPDITEVFEAEITRIPASVVVAHADSGVAVAHADGLPVVHAGMAVQNHVFTQPNAHTMTLPALGPGGNVTLNNGAALEVVGGPLTDGSGTMDAHAAMAVDAHVVTAQPDPHPAADIVAALATHAVAAALIAHAASGVTVAVGAVPTRISKRIIQLDVATVLGDLLTLAYHEVGERVLAS